MQKYLQIESIDKYRKLLLQRTKDDLLSFFSLDPDLRSLITDFDVSAQSFSADIFYDFFIGLLSKKMQITGVTYQAIFANSATVAITPIQPNSRSADKYIADSPAMLGPKMDFAIPEDITKTQQMLEQALQILPEYKESGLQTKLLNSIAIYSGNYPIPTSCSTLLCQGRFYALNVGNEYPLFYYLDMVVHEVAHQYLQIINYLEPLSVDNNKKILSAGNNKMRPAYGIINAAFVLYRLIIFYENAADLMCKHEEARGLKDPNAYLQTRFFQIPFNYELRLQVYKLKLQRSLEQLESSDALSEKGLELVRLMSRH